MAERRYELCFHGEFAVAHRAWLQTAFLSAPAQPLVKRILKRNAAVRDGPRHEPAVEIAEVRTQCRLGLPASEETIGRPAAGANPGLRELYVEPAAIGPAAHGVPHVALPPLL